MRDTSAATGGTLPAATVTVRPIGAVEGPGVPETLQPRIFERFTRGSESRHRVGTGLGLALVAEHAGALGGAAWVEDREGGGARFVVRLRAARKAVSPEDDE